MKNFGEIRQLGHVVPDMNQALEFWTGHMGIGPFFVSHDIVFADYRYRGQPAVSPRVSLAVAYSGDVQIELIHQVDDTPSAYTEFLAAGRSGLHHYSSWFADRDEYENARSWALERGFKLVMESRPEVGIRLAYFETGHPAGALFEISEALVPAIAGGMDVVRELCAKWDGSQPVRTSADL